MIPNIFRQPLLSATCSVLLACTVCEFFGAGTATAGVPATEATIDMAASLRAVGPHSSLANQADLIARLIGIWDVEYTDYSKQGEVTHRTGQFTVGWVLDGRALQDVWIVDGSGAQTEREMYSDTLYFDTKSGAWHAIFVDPKSAFIARFSGSAGADRIVLTTRDFPGLITRWSYYDIRPDSLAFQDEASNDDGKTWRLQAQYRMKRPGVTGRAGVGCGRPLCRFARWAL